jgi:hypothetical protein
MVHHRKANSGDHVEEWEGEEAIRPKIDAPVIHADMVATSKKNGCDKQLDDTRNEACNSKAKANL